MKKWTYLVAALLTASAGSLLTGCIDNDEPYGIEQIRVATANLLEAKKAAVEAEAAAASAEVEVAKIKAEIEKARIEVEKIAAEAAAKVQEAEAQAKLLQAQAAAAKTEAEAQQLLAQAAIAQAQADAIKADTEAQAKLAAAKLQDFIAQSEIAIKSAQQKYDEAVYAFEQLKKNNLEAANDKLFQAVTATYQAYLNQLAAYNAANENYLKAQRALAESEVDLKWVNNGFTSTKYDQKEILENAVADAQALINNIKNSTEIQEEYISKLEGIQASELYGLLEDYKAKQKENDAAIAELDVKRAEIELNNRELFESLPGLQDAATEANNKSIEVPAYTYPGNAAIPGFQNEVPVIPDGLGYTVSNQHNYIWAVGTYEDKIKSMQAAILDENGKAWTQAQIAELKRRQAPDAEAYEEDLDLWKVAVAVYNGGEKPVLTGLPKQGDFETAITNFNKAGETLDGLKATLLQAQKDATAADKAYAAAEKLYYQGTTTEAATNAMAVYDKAIEDAEKAHETAVKANNAAVTAAQNAVTSLQTSQANAETAALNRVNSAQRALTLAQETQVKNPTDASAAAAVVTAQNALTAAQKAYSDLLTANATAMQKAQDAVTAANDKAYLNNMAADNALANAKEAAALALQIAGGQVGPTDPAYAPVQEASDKLAAANKAVTTATKAFTDAATKVTKDQYKKLNDAINAQLKATGMTGRVDLSAWNEVSDKYNTYIDVNASTFEKAKYPTTTVDKLSPFMFMDSQKVYANAKAFVFATSYEAYGDVVINGTTPNDPAFGVPVDRLEPLTKADIDKYIAKVYPYMASYNYYRLYRLFGTFGQTLYNGNRLETAEAYLQNPEIVAEAVKALQANLDSIKATNEAAVEAAEKADEALAAAKKQIDALYQDVDNALRDLNWTARNYNTIVSSISNAIAKINSDIAFNGGDAEEVIKDLIKQAQDQIAANEKQLESADKQLAKAQYQLDQYNNGYANLENPLKLSVEMAKAELDRQADALAFVKGLLEDAQARYEAATKQK